MKINNHLGKIILTDKIFVQKIIDTHVSTNKDFIIPSVNDPRRELEKFLLDNSDNQNYIVANTVINSLDFIKLARPYNYSVFKDVIDEKTKTFLLASGETVRIKRIGDVLRIGVIYQKDNRVQWDFWKGYLDTGKSTMQVYSEAEEGKYVILNQFDKSIEYFEHKVFALLCFVYLSEIQVVEMLPNTRFGTQKTGKVLNNTELKFTLINSDWNFIYVKSEGFSVSGHFALRAVGVGRTGRRVVFIEPYQKHGYIRKVKK